MIDLTLNTPFLTVLIGPDNSTPPLPALYLNGSVSAIALAVTQIGTTNAWALSFTPTSTGLFTLVAFGKTELRAQCYIKSLYLSLKNIEDEALGSWQWDKRTGLLTLLRQDGTALGTYTALDGLTEASREKLT